MRTQLTAEFAALADTEGTFQNTSRHAVIEIATSTTKNTGIVLRAGETRSIKSDDTLYARVAEVSDNTETVYLAHEPFKGTGEGGDSRDSRKPSTAYAVGALVDGAGLEPGLALRCTTAGTTAAAALDCSGYELGDTITDGTAEWLVTEYVTLDEAGGISPRVTGSVDLGSASKKWGSCIFLMMDLPNCKTISPAMRRRITVSFEGKSFRTHGRNYRPRRRRMTILASTSEIIKRLR